MKTPPASARLAAAALKIAAAKGWPAVTIDAVAKAAKLSPAAVKRDYPALADLIPAMADWIDGQALAGFVPAGSPVETLFDASMARFDVWQGHRRAILALAACARRDGPLRCALARAAWASANRLWDAVAVENAPLPRPAMIAGLTAAHAYAAYAWQKDDSRDMAKTMAALDRALRWADKGIGLLEQIALRFAPFGANRGRESARQTKT